MNELIKKSDSDIVPLIERAVMGVREDMRDNPYILEAVRVLPVQGYRSAIGAFWNAVVDDLRNKILFRSVSLFNKEVEVGREIKTYEDFQNYVNDDQLIEGAYKIGVIGWEAYKILRHSKESRHIFYGHPKSSEPSLVKVLSVIDDCIKYVLNEEYPTQIIDIDEYIDILKSESYDRNTVAIENALGDLPETYKNELANRLFTIYTHPDSSSTLTSNIEFVGPLLWAVLPKPNKIQIVRRIDQVLPKGDATVTDKAFDFVHLVGGMIYLSHNARKYKIAPLVEELKGNLDNWDVENRCVRELKQFSSVIVEECIDDYVWALTHTYVGYIGGSARFSRTDFYANGAAAHIPEMFQAFNDRMAGAFINAIKSSKKLKRRIKSPSKIKRLRSLGMILDEKVSDSFEYQGVLTALVDESKEEEFFEEIKKG
ncbi:MAG: hypothetical protein JAY63_00035 [Candidatus Thiodiazotropha taylori]|nr:hypothetical protein [Candidatus Thiodiazotropha taylori]